MKFPFLFFCIIYLSIISIVSGKVSEDCEKLNNFLKNISEIKNCEEDYCNEYGNITKLKFKIKCFNEKNCIEIRKNIDFETFPIFPELNELYINAIEINTLPNAFFNLPNLDILEITNSGITQILDISNSYSSLSKINLSHNKIQEFPYQLKVFQNLATIDLSYNEISESITDYLLNFSSLKSLNITNNHINGNLVIPETLEIIDVGNNNLFSLEYNNDVYSPLTYMNLSNNEFNENVFDTILKFKNLITLNLENNDKIKSIPQEISTLIKLENLNLSGLGIHELPSNIFKLELYNFIMENNPQLSAGIIGFPRKIDYCSFKNTFILCYDKIEETCRSYILGLNDRKECSDKSIKEIKDKMTEEKEPIVSKDCQKMNSFLNKDINKNCCDDNWIVCDGYGNIINLG
eukprot:jgi/Orpsp1_1/1177836/evm.model.c7180000063057.1